MSEVSQKVKKAADAYRESQTVLEQETQKMARVCVGTSEEAMDIGRFALAAVIKEAALTIVDERMDEMAGELESKLAEAGVDPAEFLSRLQGLED